MKSKARMLILMTIDSSKEDTGRARSSECIDES
jgi:hypothetical protein